MDKSEYIYIVVATALVLFVIHTCSNGINDELVDNSSPASIVSLSAPEPLEAGSAMVSEIANQPETPRETVVPLPKPVLVEVEQEDKGIAPLDESASVSVPAPVLEHVGKSVVASGEGLDLVVAGVENVSTSDMVLVPAGCFLMGNPRGDAFEYEIPAHRVCLSGFYLDSLEVTQKAFRQATGRNPSRFEGDKLPVDSVSWNDAFEYCTYVGKRLPTEAEWEYAAKSAEDDGIWSGTEAINVLHEYAWFSRNSSGRTHEPGVLKPNALGFYDMSGNVREWVSDWFHEHYDTGDTVNDPSGPEDGVDKVLRGGSWDDLPRYNQVSYKVRLSPSFRNSRNGFRCALDSGEKAEEK